MELKDFQQRVLDTIDGYLDELKANQQTTVNCSLVYQNDWKSELGGLVVSTGAIL